MLVLCVEQGLEVGEGVAFSVDAQGVLDGVGGRIDPFLVATVGVVGDGEGAVPRGDGVGLRPQFLGLLGVVGQNVVAGNVGVVALKRRSGEVLGGGTGAVEDGLHDGVAVDGHRDGLAAQLAFLTGEVGEVLRDREVLGASVGLVHGAARQLGLVGGEHGGRNGVENVHGVGRQILVGRVEARVEDEGHAVVLGLGVTHVVLVGNGGELDVVLPRVGGGHLVGAVAHGGLAAGIRISQRGIRERCVGDVSQTRHEVRGGVLQLRGEGVVVNFGQAGDLAVALVVGAFEHGEECSLLLVLRGDKVPGLDEVVSLDGGAVGELAVVVELDGPLGSVLVGFDRLGDVEDGLAVSVVADELAEQNGQDPAAAVLVGQAGQERVLGLGAVRGNDLVAGAGRRGGVAAAGAGGQSERGSRGDDEPCLLQVHGFFLLVDGWNWGRCPQVWSESNP